MGGRKEGSEKGRKRKRAKDDGRKGRESTRGWSIIIHTHI
jgi:hypothetical protein